VTNLNSSFGIGKEFSQTGINGPSIFPNTSLAIRARSEIGKSFYLQTGIFSGVSGDPQNPRGTHVKIGGNNGALIISEMAYIRGKEEKSENKYSKYGVGFWSYTKTFDHISATVPGTATPIQANNNGTYFLAEQTIFEPLALFARYGVANSEVNRFHSNFTYGLVATGLIPSRINDRLGLAVTTVNNGSEYKKLNLLNLTPVSIDETTYEISYKVELKKGFAIQPDFQWVLHPNTDPTLKAAKVGVIRFEIAL
jgi:porin